MKKFLIVLIIVFTCGILSADVCMNQIQESDILLGSDFYEQYANAKLVFKNVFWNIVYERVKLFAVLLLLCFTPIRNKIGILCAPVFAFIWGFYLMSCIVELGVAGLVVGLASVLPHGVLYGTIIGVMIGRQRARKYQIKNRITAEASSGVFVILLFVTACVIESLVGTHFIPWVIRLSMI